MAPLPSYPESVTTIISTVGHNFRVLLSSPAIRRTLQLHCTSKLTIPNSRFFEFFDHSILSSLYWGIETIEIAINTDSAKEQNTLLANSEKMLQVPAMLDEDATTAGKYIVCCSYFHLALIRMLWSDEWQMAMHFLQAVLVLPSCVETELAPELYASLFNSLATNGGEEAARQQARRYKDSLMFYQVVCCDKSRINQFRGFSRSRFLQTDEQEPTLAILMDVKKANHLDPSYDMGRKNIMAIVSNSAEEHDSAELNNRRTADESFDTNIKDSLDIRLLQEMLEESHSDSSVSTRSDSTIASESEFLNQLCITKGGPGNVFFDNEDPSAANITDSSALRCTLSCDPIGSLSEIPAPDNETNGMQLLSYRANGSRTYRNFSTLYSRVVDTNSYFDYQREEFFSRTSSPSHDVRCLSSITSKFQKKYHISELIHHESFAQKNKKISITEKDFSEDSSPYQNARELLQEFENVILSLCASENSWNCDDVNWEMNTMWKMLHNIPVLKYSSAKQEMLQQLLKNLSSSKRESEVRASVSILLGLISVDKAIIDDIKRENSHLYNLATALKRNVHEAASLIYLLNPSPSELRSLELLPYLVEVACSSNKEKQGMRSLSITPTSASIAMIEILVTAFDYVTNNMHLTAISSPQVLTKFVNVAMKNKISEGVALTTILMRCMRLNGNCRKFLSQVTPIDPFIHLLRSNKMIAKSAALDYFHELLLMPRSSAIRLLQQIQQAERTSIEPILLAFVKQVKNEKQLLAANLLLQLDIMEGTKCRSMFAEAAIGALLDSVETGENPSLQSLSSFILSNIGGTFAWTGESYTAAWLLNKAGLKDSFHRNLVKYVDWLDPCLQDSEICAWNRRAAKVILKSRRSAFCALAKGMRSQQQSVRRNCIITIAWLGSEMEVIRSRRLRYCACEILLDDIASFLHPGTQLDERVIACLTIYNYTSGKGKEKLLNFSEGVRESLRRLSGITWMAEELLNVTDYFLPTKPRVSCVHTQILEIVNIGNGSVTALIFYKGYLYSGFSDGSIKVWDIKEQLSVLLCEVKMHKRSVTCFSIYEPADSLLSGSVDKTVRVWKIIRNRLECVEVIQVMEPVQHVGACNENILIVSQSRGLKVCHASRSIQTVCKNKHVTSLAVFQRKVYLGCTDSSMQEIDIEEENEVEIRAPTTSWKKQRTPIHAICVYKDWVYCAGASIEGSNAKDWRRRRQPLISIKMSRRNIVQAMTVAEDFLYLNRSSSPSTVQILLREKRQSVGRLSAGSKVTSLLTANDIILCGTEAGLIKGWIPL
ncbi:putative E3 ubiquitin-protein ligase LIN-1 isoform X2 [Phalaenopsis equestris]|uniref:putative E3 ubiquitin-protein ligase LIN-1 isoform X2 n=1 Tax=Phalaenopsis equestris TaxID=78828 RepID=UPI0009E34556|nr:putative E3 ubiquitin-protein ligase LIN-1 isoform X2 [Phalaenopsis equestris]